jgi:hypothetical protein
MQLSHRNKWLAPCLILLIAVFSSIYGISRFLRIPHSQKETYGNIEIAPEYERPMGRTIGHHLNDGQLDNQVENISNVDILDRAYSELEGPERLQKIFASLQGLASEDPLGAVEWVLQMAPDQTQRRAISIVFKEWGETQPDYAASWVMDNLDLPSPLLNAAASTLTTTWISSAPNDAMTWADNYFTVTEDYSPFQDAIITWAEDDIRAAAEHISNTQYHDATSYIAFIDFLNVYAKKNLNEAVQWANVNVPQEFQAGAQLLITREMTKTQPSEAAAYVLKDENATYLRSNLGGLLSQWARNNISAADEWVRGNLNESQKDVAYEHLALIVKFEQPRLAAQYAQAINDEVNRAEVTTDILIDWREKSRRETDQWISEKLDSIDPTILREVGYFDD